MNTKPVSKQTLRKAAKFEPWSYLVTLERQCWANAQYSRRECLDIVGIPREVSGEVMEDKVLNIFDRIGCSISPDNIKSCHLISKKSDTVIVKFFRRKDCQQVWQVKKHLQKMKMEDFDFFFYPSFLSRTFTNHRTAREGGGHYIHSLLPLPPASQVLRH